MRYVIVCLIKGEALDFHEEIVKEVCTRFDVKRQRLPAHFTIKAPFETDKIEEIESLTEEFCRNHAETPITLEDYGHFRTDVVYMKVKASSQAVHVNNEYMDALKDIPWLEWKRNEGKNKVFHCTIVSKIREEKFDDIFNYAIKHPFSFSTHFDNISILRWDRDRWVTYKEYVME